MEHFAKIVLGKNSITLVSIWFFDDFWERGGVEVNLLTQNWLLLKANSC